MPIKKSAKRLDKSSRFAEKSHKVRPENLLLSKKRKADDKGTGVLSRWG